MTERFSPNVRAIRLSALVEGPKKRVFLRMLLDTGATRTVLTWEAAIACGYDPGTASKRLQVATASGFETCPEIVLSQLTFLGRRMCDFPVLCHPLPAELHVDGLVGLDFFRGTKLTVDFQIGEVTLDV